VFRRDVPGKRALGHSLRVLRPETAMVTFIGLT